MCVDNITALPKVPTGLLLDKNNISFGLLLCEARHNLDSEAFFPQAFSHINMEHPLMSSSFRQVWALPKPVHFKASTLTIPFPNNVFFFLSYFRVWCKRLLSVGPAPDDLKPGFSLIFSSPLLLLIHFLRNRPGRAIGSSSSVLSHH